LHFNSTTCITLLCILKKQ